METNFEKYLASGLNDYLLSTLNEKEKDLVLDFRVCLIDLEKNILNLNSLKSIQNIFVELSEKINNSSLDNYTTCPYILQKYDINFTHLFLVIFPTFDYEKGKDNMMILLNNLLDDFLISIVKKIKKDLFEVEEKENDVYLDYVVSEINFNGIKFFNSDLTNCIIIQLTDE